MNQNQFIAEKVMGVCYHESHLDWVRCERCDSTYRYPNYEKNPADYFALLMNAIKKEWWGEFYVLSSAGWKPKRGEGIASGYARWLLAPENLAGLIAEYHGWTPEERASDEEADYVLAHDLGLPDGG